MVNESQNRPVNKYYYVILNNFLMESLTFDWDNVSQS
jgi:hypothetical protein